MAISKAVRAALKLRNGGCCEACGNPNATDPHHRKLQSQGGPDTLSNLLWLCRQCHDHAHKYVRLSRRWGRLIKREADPSQVPVRRFDRTRGATVLVLLRDDGTINEEVPAWAECNLWAP